MMKDITLDTSQQLQYEKRIEYQQLATARALQHKYTLYNELNFLPSLDALFDLITSTRTTGLTALQIKHTLIL